MCGRHILAPVTARLSHQSVFGCGAAQIPRDWEVHSSRLGCESDGHHACAVLTVTSAPHCLRLCSSSPASDPNRDALLRAEAMGECLSVAPSSLSCLERLVLMVLLCLNCASADCSCGRLAWLVNFVNHAKGAEDAVRHAQEPVFGSIDGAVERVDPSAELEDLFVLKPHDD